MERQTIENLAECRIGSTDAGTELEVRPGGLFAPPLADDRVHPPTFRTQQLDGNDDASEAKLVGDIEIAVQSAFERALTTITSARGLTIDATRLETSELPPRYPRDANGELPRTIVIPIRIDTERTLNVRLLAEENIDMGRVATAVEEALSISSKLPKYTLDTLNFDRQYQMPYMGDMRGVLAYFWPGKSAIHFPLEAVSTAEVTLKSGDVITESELYDRRVLGGRATVAVNEDGSTSVTRSWFVPNTSSALAAVLQHEMGHRAARQIAAHDRRGWDKVLDEVAKDLLGDTADAPARLRRLLNPDIPRQFRTGSFTEDDWKDMKAITSKVSEYGSYSLRELEAELFCEWVGSPAPSTTSKLFGDAIDRYLGAHGTVRLDEPEDLLPSSTAPETVGPRR
jgi:hypothetical protein